MRRPLPNTEGHRECGDCCFALNRLQWVRNGLTLTTADDYNSKVLSERGGAGQRVGYTKTSPRASPNRITQNHAIKPYALFSLALLSILELDTPNDGTLHRNSLFVVQ